MTSFTVRWMGEYGGTAAIELYDSSSVSPIAITFTSGPSLSASGRGNTPRRSSLHVLTVSGVRDVEGGVCD